MSERQHRRSDLETFDGCPFRFNEVVNNGVDDQSDEAKRGVAFHIMALIYIKLLARAACSMDYELAKQAYVQGLRMYPLPTHLLQDVSNLWRRHTASFELDLDAYFAAEQQQQTRRFKFIPDLVLIYPMHLVIWDWKTYFRALSEVQARREFQPKFYLWQALQLWPGFAKYTFVFVFVRFNVRVELTYTPEEIEAFGPEIEGIVQGLEQAEIDGKWPAIPGSHCAVCRLNCPIADNPKLLPVRLGTPQEAVTVGGEILVLEKRLRTLRKALSGYCSIDGPVAVGGQVFAHSAYPMKRYPAKPAIEICEDQGFIMDGATLSRSGLGFAKFPLPVADRLAAIEIHTKRAKFGHKKLGEDLPYGVADALDVDDPGDEDE